MKTPIVSMLLKRPSPVSVCSRAQSAKLQSSHAWLGMNLRSRIAQSRLSRQRQSGHEKKAKTMAFMLVRKSR